MKYQVVDTVRGDVFNNQIPTLDDANALACHWANTLRADEDRVVVNLDEEMADPIYVGIGCATAKKTRSGVEVWERRILWDGTTNVIRNNHEDRVFAFTGLWNTYNGTDKLGGVGNKVLVRIVTPEEFDAEVARRKETIKTFRYKS